MINKKDRNKGNIKKAICRTICAVLFGSTLAFASTSLSVSAANGLTMRVDADPEAVGGHGGVDIDLQFSGSLLTGSYQCEVEQSSDGGKTWNTVGLNWKKLSDGSQDYNHAQVNVLNVYPDTAHSTKGIVVPDVIYSYADGSTKTLPRSAALKVWMEGGRRRFFDPVKGIVNETFNPAGEVEGRQLVTVESVTFTEFKIKCSTYLFKRDYWDQYDVLMFGTWDANAHNDLDDTTFNMVKWFLMNKKCVVFGHDTLGFGITNHQGSMNPNFNQFLGTNASWQTGWSKVPASVPDPGSTAFNTGRHYRNYQCWGGPIQNSAVTLLSEVEVSKDGGSNLELISWPWNLVENNGVSKKLDIPLTHTSWIATNGNMPLIAFTQNEKNLFSDIVGTAATEHYLSEKNYKNEEGKGYQNYNWYLGYSTRTNSYMIQTGHSNCDSTEDERKILANVFLNSKKLINTVEGGSGSYLNPSAQDVAKPEVLGVSGSWGSNGTMLASIQGRDYGSTYQFRANVYKGMDFETPIVQSEVKSATVTTGLQDYYYIVNGKADYEFAIDATGAQKVSAANPNLSISYSAVEDLEAAYIHVVAVDRAGNVGDQFTKKLPVIDFSLKSNPLIITNAPYRSGDGTYYVKPNESFVLTASCMLSPYSSLLSTPVRNHVKLKGGSSQYSCFQARLVNTGSSITGSLPDWTVSSVTNIRSTNQSTLTSVITAKITADNKSYTLTPTAESFINLYRSNVFSTELAANEATI